MSAASDAPFPAREPTRALLLAQALEACIEAERLVPGSAEYFIAGQPAWARAELRRLVSLAESLDAVATNAAMSEDFRAGARGRLMQRIGGEAVVSVPTWGWLSTLPSHNGHHPVGRHRSKGWVWRGGLGGMLAAVLVAAATLTASANALPGEPLYGIKQVQEDLGVRLAPDDQSRALALLNLSDARLDETARLLQAGRTDEAAQTTQRFDDAIDRATTTFVTIVDQPPDQPATSSIETRLTEQQAQLQALLVTAPEPARADLRQALVATERGRALLADSQAIGRGVDAVASGADEDETAAAEPVPTMAAESEPTLVPRLVRATPQPVAVIPDQHTVASTAADDVEQPAADEGTPAALAQVAPSISRGARGGSVPSGVSRSSDGRQSTVKPLQITLDAAPATANVVVGAATTSTSGDDDARASGGTDVPGGGAGVGGGGGADAARAGGGDDVSAPQTDDQGSVTHQRSVVQPSPNHQDTTEARVAEQSSTSQPAVVAQDSANRSAAARSESNGTRSTSASASTAVVAQSSHTDGADTSNQAHSDGADNSNQSSRTTKTVTAASTASQNARTPSQPAPTATSSTSSDHHGSSSGDGGTNTKTGGTTTTSSTNNNGSATSSNHGSGNNNNQGGGHGD